MKKRILTLTFALTMTLALIAVLSPNSAQADMCIRLDKAGGSETLVNVCLACRTVKVERFRSGSKTGVPTAREYLIPGGGKQPLSFRGPGRTKIVQSQNCPGRDMSGAPEGVKSDGKACVQIGDQPGVGRLLVNSCQECRMVKLRNVAADGLEQTISAALAGRSFLPVQDAGTRSTKIISDAPCP